MAVRNLAGCRILVVEDEYILADWLSTELEEAEAVVLGPAATLADALDIIGSEQSIHGAILDVDLGGEPVFPAAELLIQRHNPIVFTTGHDAASIPLRFQHVDRCEKPVSFRRLVSAIGSALHA